MWIKVQLKFILICDSPLTALHYTLVIFVYVYSRGLSTKFGKVNRSLDVTYWSNVPKTRVAKKFFEPMQKAENEWETPEDVEND
jgi:hypothetical protein